MAASAADEKKRQRLLVASEELNPQEQAALLLLAIACEPAARTPLLQCANRAGLTGPRKARLISKTWNSLIASLKKAELVVEARGKVYCEPLIAEVLTRRAVRQGQFEKMAKAVEACFPSYSNWGGFYYPSYERYLRDLRLALYRNDEKKLHEIMESSRIPKPLDGEFESPWERICNNPFDREWMAGLPRPILEPVLHTIILFAHDRLEPVEEQAALAEELCSADPKGVELLNFTWAQHLILTGQLEKAYALTMDKEDANQLVLRAWLHMLAGDDATAIPCYEAGLQDLRKTTRKRKIYLNSLSGVYFILSLLRSGRPEHLQQASDYLAIATKQPEHPFVAVYLMLQQVIALQQAQLKTAEIPWSFSNIGETLGRDFLFFVLAHYWTDHREAKKHSAELEKILERAEASGYVLIAAQAAELSHRLSGKKEHAEKAEALYQQMGIVGIVDAVPQQEPWQRALKALAGLRQDAEPGPGKESESRLVWLLRYLEGPYSDTSISALEQKKKKGGGWTKGRAVSLKKLFNQRDNMDCLTEQDERICRALEVSQDYGRYGYHYGRTTISFDDEKALREMVGHPLIFLQDNPSVRVELVEGEPELQVTQKGKDVVLELQPAIGPGDEEITIVRETPTRLRIISVTAEHRRIAAILGDKGLRVPVHARDEIVESLATVASVVTVHSDIGGGAENAEKVEADLRPHLHLLPFGEGLKAELLVQPLGAGGISFPPGFGGATIFGQIEGRPLQTTRDLKAERRMADAVRDGCSVLQRIEEMEGQWLIEEPEDCLELLLELQALGDAVAVEWPEGEKIKIRGQVSFQDLALRVQQENDWFGLSGEVHLDDELVLDVRRLLELLGETRGRFLPLGDGQFVALTQEFRKRMEEIDSFAERHGRGVRFNPLLAPVIEELADGAASLEVDAAWREQLVRLQNARELMPQVPSTLQAELRDYQVEGFCWSARLAHWGVGACLADDMGLGKTVQALALFLERGSEGPGLVVAPTSVCANWIDEARRFAPTLQPIPFGPGDRHRALKSLGPFDLVVCSYGLLQQEEELLGTIAWQTIVLDEAQAIKNSMTKRSRAAMSLQGKFKMITTGTPIENHLGELWNLFRFLNPGLLGSLERFNQHFAGPIEKHRDRDARLRLKKLIQPFILRRTKSQVLEELPPRTEIALEVEMSREERVLYEALRQQAVETLTDSQATAGHKHLQILAEIMKLRRVCCHPRLVLPDTKVASAKMEVFGQTLDELLENRHKVLVFSQFVGYLSIVREYLDEREIFYQYLDGSTPARERKKRVDAFQAGQGDVFLISLKAGGQGLNLTAADYVIHLDPWWNPAVEDQASDRVHRIGQERPVTIYRLVTKDTIEEKIVGLHHRKRDLADSLLEGSEMSGRVSADELLQLIKGG